MNIFEAERPDYYGVAAFGSKDTMEAWLSRTAPDGWTYHEARGVFTHPSGALVRTALIRDDRDWQQVAGCEFQRALIDDAIDGDNRAYLLTRVRRAGTNITVEVGAIKVQSRRGP